MENIKEALLQKMPRTKKIDDTCSRKNQGQSVPQLYQSSKEDQQWEAVTEEAQQDPEISSWSPEIQPHPGLQKRLTQKHEGDDSALLLKQQKSMRNTTNNF